MCSHQAAARLIRRLPSSCSSNARQIAADCLTQAVLKPVLCTQAVLSIYSLECEREGRRMANPDSTAALSSATTPSPLTNTCEMLQAKTDEYLINKSKQLIKLVTDPELIERRYPLIDISVMPYLPPNTDTKRVRLTADVCFCCSSHHRRLPTPSPATMRSCKVAMKVNTNVFVFTGTQISRARRHRSGSEVLENTYTSEL